MQDFISGSALDFVFAAIVVVSFIFALLSLVGLGIGEALDFDVDTDADGFFDVGISPFSLAVFGSAFGITGLIAHLWLEMGTIPSILLATGVGLLFGGLAQVFFIYILSPSKSSHFSLEEEAVGREAEVIITIPKAGLGKIAFKNVGGRITLGARSASGEPISTGKLVTIEKIVGRSALVRPVNDQH